MCTLRLLRRVTDDLELAIALAVGDVTDLERTLNVADWMAIANMSFTMHDFTDGPPNRPGWIIHHS